MVNVSGKLCGGAMIKTVIFMLCVYSKLNNLSCMI